VLGLLKRYTQVEGRDDTRTIRARVTGQVLTLDEALLWLLEALPEDHPFLTLEPPSGADIHWRRSSVCSCAKARCSRCCWSAKICTGSMRKRRPCSWSTIAPGTSTAGAAKRITRNCMKMAFWLPQAEAVLAQVG
jgi:hypothetical protein